MGVLNKLRNRFTEGRIVPKRIVFTTIVIGVVVLTGAFNSVANIKIQYPVKEPVATPEPRVLGEDYIYPSATPVNTPEPTLKAVYIDPDPVIDCGPGVNSKQVVRVKSSQCQDYTDCGFYNGKWMLMTKSDCERLQAEERAIYTSNNKLIIPPSGQYNNYTPIPLPTINVKPLPTVEPYKPSQEYTNAMQKALENLSQPWQPTQFNAPTKKCYATWDEYFAAHPSNGANIAGAGSPPCE